MPVPNPNPSTVVMPSSGRLPVPTPSRGTPGLARLWEMLEPHTEPLTLVLRTREQRFDGVDVPVHWIRDHSDHAGRANQPNTPRSHLLVDIPDEVICAIQSVPATAYMQRYFGQRWKVKLDEPVLSPYAMQRGAHPDLRDDCTVIVNDWQEFRSAVKAAVTDCRDVSGGPRFQAHTFDGPREIYARVEGGLLEISIDHLERMFQQMWDQERKQ